MHWLLVRSKRPWSVLKQIAACRQIGNGLRWLGYWERDRQWWCDRGLIRPYGDVWEAMSFEERTYHRSYNAIRCRALDLAAPI